MPTFLITAPDGKKYKITGATKEGALAALKSHLASTDAQAAAKTQAGKVNPETGNTIPDFVPIGKDGKPIPGYNAQTGMVEHTGVADKGLAFSGGAVEGVPIVGPTLRKAVQAGGAAIGTAINGKSFGENYDQAGGFIDQAQQDNPNTALAGQITGAVAPMIAAGGTALGARVLGMGAAPLLERTLASGTSNAVISGADTAARGGDLGDILKSAAVGAGVGSILPGAGDVVSSVGRSIYDTVAPRINALVRPMDEAAKRAGRAYAIDAGNTGAPILTAADQAAAARNGQTLLNVDRGGMTTRSLLRSATNQDPEAHALVADTVTKRLEARGQDVNDFIDRLAGGNVSDLAAQDAVSAAAKKTNGPAYRQAYKDGADLVKTPELERLMGSPAVVDAMKAAITKGKDRAIKDGLGTFNPAVSITNDGRIAFNKVKPGGGTTFPDLQFWDYTKKELDAASKVAARAGRTDEAGVLTGLSKQLRTELDKIVPSYATARSGAAAFFGAEDALDAGKKFVMQNRTLDETARALAKFTPKERQAFAIGFASELKDMVKQTGGVNVIDRIWGKTGSTQAKDKIMLALGQKNYGEFEQFVKVDAARDSLRKIMSGSDTTRKLIELGMARIGGGVGTGLGVGGGTFAMTGDWKSSIVSGAVAGLTRKYTGYADVQMTKQIAKLLLSDDPTALQRATTMAAKNPRAAKALEAIQTAIGSAMRGVGDTAMAPKREPLQITVGRPANPIGAPAAP